MASGIEIAGVVLATLPLCVEIAKAYTGVIRSGLNMAIPSRYDERLKDFYYEFYWNIGELDKNIVRIWTASSRGIGNRPSALELSRWHNSSDVENNLKQFLKSDTAYHQYIITTTQIATLLVQLLADGTNRINENSLVGRSGPYGV